MRSGLPLLSRLTGRMGVSFRARFCILVSIHLTANRYRGLTGVLSKRLDRQNFEIFLDLEPGKIVSMYHHWEFHICREKTLSISFL